MLRVGVLIAPLVAACSTKDMPPGDGRPADVAVPTGNLVALSPAQVDALCARHPTPSGEFVCPAAPHNMVPCCAGVTCAQELAGLDPSCQATVDDYLSCIVGPQGTLPAGCYALMACGAPQLWVTFGACVSG